MFRFSMVYYMKISKGDTTVNEEQKEAIIQFFVAVKKLKDTGVIRSSKYTGDIAEFLVAEMLEIELSDNQREPGYDGVDATNRKVQIKYHGGVSGNNIIINEGNFDDVIVVLAPDSKLRIEKCTPGCFSIFKLSDYSSGNIAKESLRNAELILELNGELKKI